MTLTRNFKDTVAERAKKDLNFRYGLLEQSINEFLTGDLYTAKALLRDYINAAISFDELAKQTNISNKSLQRMLSPQGNPTTSNFCAILQAIQTVEGIAIGVNLHH